MSLRPRARPAGNVAIIAFVGRAASSPGSGTTATLIEAVSRNARDDSLDSYSVGFAEAVHELQHLANSCRAPDWDGYGAQPVTRDAVAIALRFLKSLPLGLRPPTIGACSDGTITFEWYESPTWLLTISVGCDSILHYAGLFGADRHYGSEQFLDTTPRPILEFIRQSVVA